jgi:hypothetical protein
MNIPLSPYTVRSLVHASQAGHRAGAGASLAHGRGRQRFVREPYPGIRPSPRDISRCSLRSHRPKPVKAAVVNAWDVRPTLERIVFSSSGRIVRNRLIPAPGPDPAPPAAYLRASTEHAGHPVAPSIAPAAGDSAVAQSTTAAFICLVRDQEPIGDIPPRHIPRPTSLRALRYVPSGVVVRAWLPEPFPAAIGCSGFMIDVGSETVIGITPRVWKPLP